MGRLVNRIFMAVTLCNTTLLENAFVPVGWGFSKFAEQVILITPRAEFRL